MAIFVNILAGLLCGLTFYENNGFVTDFWLNFISYPIRETLASVGYFVAINELLYYFYYHTESNLNKLSPILALGLCVSFTEYASWYGIFSAFDIIPDWLITIRLLFGSFVTKIGFFTQLVSIGIISFPVAEKPLSSIKHTGYDIITDYEATKGWILLFASIYIRLVGNLIILGSFITLGLLAFVCYKFR